jgi:hypothetical protein
MYSLIIAFYLSFLGIIVMVLLKRYEVNSGKATVVSRIGQGSDHLFHDIFGALKHGASYVNKHSFIAIAQWIAFHVLLRVRNIYVELKDRALSNPHSRKVIDAVRGRGEITPHSASFYLRRISDK